MICTAAYMMILQSGGPAFRATFETMAQTSAGVILFHCTAGTAPGAPPLWSASVLTTRGWGTRQARTARACSPP